jgi:hypothetical protein
MKYSLGNMGCKGNPLTLANVELKATEEVSVLANES